MVLCTRTLIERKNYLLLLYFVQLVTKSDKDILEIFSLADEIKVSKAGLKRVIGRRLAARVLKVWVEDFVDEDTGEVVSIERNEVVLDRETVLEKEHIEMILESGTRLSFFTRRA